MEHEAVRRWVEGYEAAWRSAGTDALADLFTEDATYQMSPWRQPTIGLDAIRELWDSEREAPDEEFALRADIVAAEGLTAVVRVEVDYARESSGRWRDLWVLEFDDRGRCRAFEEWPFAPGQPDGH